MIVAILFLLLAQAQPPAFAPGAVNPLVRQDNLRQTVCGGFVIQNGQRVNWTKTQRPSRYWSSARKAELLHRAHLPLSASSLFQGDHRVPLEVGGSPTDPKNLWLQPINEAHAKDAMEDKARRQLCRGEITLREAQAIFLGEWWKSTFFKLVLGGKWVNRQ